MVGRLLSSAIQLRIAVWVVRQVLPGESDFKHRFKSGLLGIAFATAAGVLGGFAIAGLIAACGVALLEYGQFNLVSVLAMGCAVLVLMMIGLYLYTKKQFDELLTFPKRKQVRMKTKPEDDTFRAMVSGFIEGLTHEKFPIKTPAARLLKESPSVHKQAA